jgi:hypothetical protein
MSAIEMKVRAEEASALLAEADMADDDKARRKRRELIGRLTPCLFRPI